VAELTCRGRSRVGRELTHGTGVRPERLDGDRVDDVDVPAREAVGELPEIVGRGGGISSPGPTAQTGEETLELGDREVQGGESAHGASWRAATIARMSSLVVARQGRRGPTRATRNRGSSPKMRRTRYRRRDRSSSVSSSRRSNPSDDPA